MSPEFVAKPPEPVSPISVPSYLRRSAWRFAFIVWQTLVPFRSSPEEIDALPEGTAEVSDAHVKQAQWIFDQADARRDHLEQKAQSTFGLMVFLVPLLASLFVFVISKGIASSKITLALLVISSLLLLLGFISAVRAVSVKESQTLFLSALVDSEGQFKAYSNSNHARGLLYCASMNTAMNDHIAQFVKGAHVMSAAAVFVLLAAAIPASVAVSTTTVAPVQTKVVGTVQVSSIDIDSLRHDIATLKQEVDKLNSKLSEMQKTTAPDTAKKTKPSSRPRSGNQ